MTEMEKVSSKEQIVEQSQDILSQAIAATKQTEASRAEELLRALTSEAMKGTVTWNKNLTVTFKEAIDKIDEALSAQLSKIMHNERFQKLEGSWRGLQYLVQNTDTSVSMKLKVINLPKRELFKDLSKAVEFDQSQLFKKIYESEFGTAGGEPFGALIGDYEFTNHPEDIETLELTSNVAAAAFAPFISASSPELFGFNDWTELSKPRDLEKIFDSLEYARWRGFRVVSKPDRLKNLPLKNYRSMVRPRWQTASIIKTTAG